MTATRWSGATAAVVAAALLAGAAPARAQYMRGPAGGGESPPTDVAPVALEKVRVEEQLGAALPLDVTFTDGQGRPYLLRQAFDGTRPVVIALVYYDCPMLCGLIMSGMARAMRENGLALGQDYQAVTISFDPAEKPALAAERRRGYLQSMGRSEAGGDWPFLVGTAEAARTVSDALGFHYELDPVSGEWAHHAAIFVIAPDGKISRYLYGIEYPPKDFRLAVVEAARGKVGTSFDRLLLTCYRYDPASRKYQPYAFGILRAGGLAVLLGLTGLIVTLVVRERRAKGRRAA